MIGKLWRHKYLGLSLGAFWAAAWCGLSLVSAGSPDKGAASVVGFSTLEPRRGASRVTARVELLNAKVKRNGKPDASGVVVWLEAAGAVAPRPVRPRQRMLQRGKRFLPHVLAVERGTEVDFPNDDPFFHNVFSLYNGKRFDLGLYASGESRPVLFNRPGVAYIFCNIHPQMSAVVIALETPFYAVSDASGGVVFNDVPEGRYQLSVWHERTKSEELSMQSRLVTIAPGRSDLGVIRLSEEGYLPKPHPNKHGQEYDHERNKSPYGRN